MCAAGDACLWLWRTGHCTLCGAAAARSLIFIILVTIEPYDADNDDADDNDEKRSRA